MIVFSVSFDGILMTLRSLSDMCYELSATNTVFYVQVGKPLPRSINYGTSCISQKRDFLIAVMHMHNGILFELQSEIG
jgi:hypothetical protein